MQRVGQIRDGVKVGMQSAKFVREVAPELEQDGLDIVLGKGGRKHPPVEEVQVGRGVCCCDANA